MIVRLMVKRVFGKMNAILADPLDRTSAAIKVACAVLRHRDRCFCAMRLSRLCSLTEDKTGSSGLQFCRYLNDRGLQL
ncbi:hypothetical protein PHET_11555 [Paragonimus heterotremus]|uniref:Uncharacterized protein n=1 Tax=Paragonimus heterotremus TaxID=100268 RepID=A0A8J4T401_9TREM|nr:hypothetical protein PHET_11555 [Paragonimus heterotremus]